MLTLTHVFKKKTVADLHFFALWTLQFSKTYLAGEKKHGAGGSESSVKEKERREGEQKKPQKNSEPNGPRW